MTATPEEAIQALERIKEELRLLMPLLSKHRVEELRMQICQFHETKWVRRKYAKYGSINKGFTEEELNVFLGAIKEPRYKLLFEYQAYLGLRIGEACRVNLKDFNFRLREIRINTEKARTLDTLQVPQFLFDETLAYLKEHEKQIDNSQGYLFYKDRKKSTNEAPYLDLNYVRKVFRQYVSLTALNEVYASSNETNPERKIRDLHRLTTHSLRHYSITTFSRSVNGNIILSKAFARHRSIGSTQIYIHTDRKQLFEAIECAFSKRVVKGVANG
jgi:integrase